MRVFMLLSVALTLAGCASKPCGDAECAPVCEKAAAANSATSLTLTPFEKGLVDPMLADIREGVRPFSENSVGFCKGNGKECEEFLGFDVGELPPGQYMIRADVRVPKTGEPGTWKLKLDTKCVTTRQTANGEVSSESNNTRELDVRYAGEDRGYRLSPLYTVESPSKGGARKCTWVLSAPNGDRVQEWKGSWATPAVPEDAPPVTP